METLVRGNVYQKKHLDEIIRGRNQGIKRLLTKEARVKKRHTTSVTIKEPKRGKVGKGEQCRNEAAKTCVDPKSIWWLPAHKGGSVQRALPEKCCLKFCPSFNFRPTDQNIERPVQIRSQGAKLLASESKY